MLRLHYGFKLLLIFLFSFLFFLFFSDSLMTQILKNRGQRLGAQTPPGHSPTTQHFLQHCLLVEFEKLVFQKLLFWPLAQRICILELCQTTLSLFSRQVLPYARSRNLPNTTHTLLIKVLLSSVTCAFSRNVAGVYGKIYLMRGDQCDCRPDSCN